MTWIILQHNWNKFAINTNNALAHSQWSRHLLSFGTGWVSQNWYLCLAASSMLFAGPWQDSSSMALWMSCSFWMGKPGFYIQRSKWALSMNNTLMKLSLNVWHDTSNSSLYITSGQRQIAHLHPVLKWDVKKCIFAAFLLSSSRSDICPLVIRGGSKKTPHPKISQSCVSCWVMINLTNFVKPCVRKILNQLLIYSSLCIKNNVSVRLATRTLSNAF